MNKDQVKEFYEQADEYCRFIAENVIAEDTVSSVMKLLMTLYISAINLPEAEPETTASASSIPETVTVRFDEQIPTTYWETFNPYIDEDPVCGDLIDDLSDIASDLRGGMKEYESGRYGNAIFEWKLLFNIHWGQHIVDALRALHTLRTR